MGILFNENAISSGGYQIANSLRFQSASTQYLNRTFGTPTNNLKWTISAWIKKGGLGTTVSSGDQPFIAAPNGANIDVFWVEDNGSDQFAYFQNSVVVARWSPVYRDPSAWYHVVFVYDTANATQADRLVLYVNGSRVTSLSTAVSIGLNQASTINANAVIARLGGNSVNTRTFDGYLAEVNFIDGQALTPSSFGTTDPTSGQWVAAKYTGTYGTNGFYLPFSNGTSTTTLGADSSGNGNNWTLTNFTRSAGASDCWVIDVPSGNASTILGTQPASNFSVLNPLSKIGTATTSNANLAVSLTGSATGSLINGSVVVSSGKWYWEGKFDTGADSFIGWNRVDLQTGTGNAFQQAGSLIYFSTNGNLYSNGNGGAAYGTSFASTDIIGCALNLDTNQATFYKNNVAQATVSINAGNYAACFAVGGTSTTNTANFGQRSFAYTPPSGFKALCTANLPVATIKQGNKYMDATTYSGNLVGQSITNAGSFKPDLVWVKSRSAATDNKLTDSVRGAQTALVSNSTAAETTDLTGVVSFNTNGFTLGTSTTYNNTGATYVGWQWQAGQGSTSSNTNGSITSTVSVNATAGFSVVTYTGTGANATVGHGLGVAPKMVIVKARNSAGWLWPVYHASVGNTGYLRLNATDATTTDAATWQNTSPTSSVFSIGTAGHVNFNSSTTYVAYCFAEISGFSKFGSYTGNGSADGVFVYTGFRPKYVMIKLTSGAGYDWEILDTSRDTYNVAQDILQANMSSAESTGTMYTDLLSNGFKLRNSYAGTNGNGSTYIYMAFAENPFAQANAR